MASAPFDIAGHELLTEDAADTALVSHTRLAESLLGLSEATATDNDLTLIKIALVLQVNHQVERGVEANAYMSEQDGDLRYKHRDRLVSPEAASVVRAVIGDVEESYETVRLR